MLGDVFERERTALCGPRWSRSPERKGHRGGHRSKDVKTARKLLEGLARQLQSRHPSAAASLKEGLDETLTVMAMGLPEALERTLCAGSA